MRAIKPDRLSVVTRPFEVNRQFYLGISTLAFFDLLTGELLPEVAMWQFAAEQLGKDASIDAGVPKGKREFLVSGAVYTPGGEPWETCPATVRIGDQHKTIYAIGDRHWRNGDEQSSPKPFTVMPLGWERSFGGPGLPENPLGKGEAPVETEHGPVQFLPNLERPGELMERPGDRPRPAGFGPIDLTWPQRLSKAGTYDEAWLKELFPGLARDMDWTFWNLAPEDQQAPGTYRGDEPFELINLHPDEPKLTGRLPGLSALTILESLNQRKEKVLHDVPGRLTTVWFFPAQEKGILVYHAGVKTREDDGSDISLMVLAAEVLGRPRGRAHYARVVQERSSHEESVFHVLRDEDLLPLEVLEGARVQGEAAKMQALVQSSGELQRRMDARRDREIEEARAKIVALGFDPDEHGPSLPEPSTVPTDPLEVMEQTDQMRAELDQRAAESKANFEQTAQRVEELIASHGIDPSYYREELNTKLVGPPDFTADKELARMKKMYEEARALGVEMNELAYWITDPEILANWRTVEERMREGYRLSAHLQGEAPRLEGAEAERVREEILAALHAGEPLGFRDLTGADLSGLDLREAALADAWLESANLRGSNLDGADLSRAVLARADLSGTSLKGTLFTGANLGGAAFEGVAGAPGADFTEAILHRADLRRADLSGACLDHAMLMEARLEETGFGVSATSMSFFETELGGVSFRGARLVQPSFIMCDLTGADFRDSELDRATIMMGRAPRVRFAGARTKGLVALLVETMEEADFTGARLESANLRGAKLTGADFAGAVLDGSDLSETDLRRAELTKVSAKRARFVRADLREADFTGANLMEADLSKADARETRLVRCNLYAASFARVRSSRGTRLDGSLQDKVTIYPLWRESEGMS